METNIIFYLFGIALITSLIWYTYVTKLKSNYSNLLNNHQNLNQNLDKEILVKGDENVKSLQNTISELKASISEVKHTSYLEGYEKARGEFSIQVFPYKEEYTEGNDGFIINDIFHQVQVGYQYQLFVNGIPMLKPAVVIEQTLTEKKKQVDYQKVTVAMNLIEQKLLPMVAESKGLIKLLSGKKAK